MVLLCSGAKLSISGKSSDKERDTWMSRLQELHVDAEGQTVLTPEDRVQPTFSTRFKIMCVTLLLLFVCLVCSI